MKTVRPWLLAAVVASLVQLSTCANEATEGEDTTTQMSAPGNLKGPEQATRAGEDTAATSEEDVLNYPEQVVGTGSGGIEVTVSLPEGYKLIDFAPLFVSYSSGDQAIVKTDAELAEQNIETPKFPIKLPATFLEGRTTVGINLVVYYCESDREALCFMEQLRVVVPVTVQASDTAQVIEVHVPLENLGS